MARGVFQDEFADDEVAAEAAVNIFAPVPRSRKAAGPDEEEEVSIDDYMTSLLARSRGEPVPPSRPVAAETPRARAAAVPRPTPAPAVAVAKASPVVPAEPSPSAPSPASPVPAEMAPRALAPERQIDLRAMRQLANLSANNALQRHENKRLSVDTRTKLLVTIVSLVVGASLLIIHQLPQAPPVTVYGAAAAFAVAALWGSNYLSLLSRMAGERQAHLSRHLKGGEEPAAEVREEKP